MKFSPATAVERRRALILSAGFGDGHNAAAFGLVRALRGLGHEAAVLDVFDRTHPALNEFVRKAYRLAITHAPKLWSLIYRASDAADFTRRRFDVFEPSTRELKRVLEEFEPDVLISTYPLYAHLVERLVGLHGHLPYPFLSVVTDARSINSIWFSSQSDHYTLIDAPSAEVLRSAGVPEKKLHVMGFPIAPAFAREAPPIPESPLRILYLPSTTKRRVRAVLRSLAHHPSLPARHLSVVLGRHYERLAPVVGEALGAAPDGFTHEVIGWCDHMPGLLQSHHCVIGKAGGASVQESMAACCPLLIDYVVPGQEEGNATLAVDAGCALRVPDPGAVGEELSALLADGRRALLAMRDAAARTGQPAAATEIARLAISLIDQHAPSERPRKPRNP